MARKQDRQDIVKEAKKAWSTEQRERDFRKDKIVLYSLSEAPPPNFTKFANQLSTLSDDIVENPCPLRISLRKQQVCENIFENARLLPKTTFKNVSIVPDLTQQQREEVKEMRDEVDKLHKDLTEDEALNWKFCCTGKRGERFITKHIGRTNPKSTYTMKGVNLTPTDSERDIGVKVHNSLRPSLQCSEAAQRGNAVLGQISRAFHYRDRKTFIQLYKQYVRPHLEFAITAWSPWTQADIQTLQKVQQRAVKMVSGLRGSTYEERLRELQLLSLADRRDTI